MWAQSVLADEQLIEAGRPRWWVAGLSLSLLLIVGLLAWRVMSPDSEPYVAPPPPARTDPIAPAAAIATLKQLEQAVRRNDQGAAEALAAADDPGVAQQLSAIVGNAEELQVANFTLGYVDEIGAADPTDAWPAAVDVTWGFAGFDRSPANTEVLFTFREVGDQAVIASIGGGDRRTPIWLTGPVVVRRTETSLLLVRGNAQVADRYRELAERAVPQVGRVLTRWRPRLVVEVPASLTDLEQALGAAPGTYDQIAAVTATVDGVIAPATPTHVFINPELFERRREVGAQVVLTHEATHVATNAPLSTMPKWMLEGFADYVALRDVTLPLGVTAGQIAEQVRRSGVPKLLPTSADFDSNVKHLGAIYESAWLACVALAEQGGEGKLVTLYRRLDQGVSLDRALATLYDWSERDLVRAWQDRLTDLPSAPVT